MFRRDNALSRLRTKSFLAVCLVGALSGVVTGLHGKGTMGVFLYGFSGAVSVIIMASAGGFMGMFLRNAVLFFRGGRAEQGHMNTDGIFPASSFGALVGLVAVLMAADWDQAYYGAVVGAFFGGILGVLPGEGVGVLLRMLALEERGGDKEKRLPEVLKEEIQMSGEDPVEPSGEAQRPKEDPDEPEEEVQGLRELQRSEERSQEAGKGPGGPSGNVLDDDEGLGGPSEDVPEDKE